MPQARLKQGTGKAQARRSTGKPVALTCFLLESKPPRHGRIPCRHGGFGTHSKTRKILSPRRPPEPNPGFNHGNYHLIPSWIATLGEFTPNMVPNIVPNIAPNIVPNIVPNTAPNIVPNIAPNNAPNRARILSRILLPAEPNFAPNITPKKKRVLNSWTFY